MVMIIVNQKHSSLTFKYIIMAHTITEITSFKKGTGVNLVKTKIIEGQTSLAPLGKEIRGVLAKDIQLGLPVCIQIQGEEYYHATSIVYKLSFPTGKMIIETETSIYEMDR